MVVSDERLQQFVDGELAGADREAVDRHIAVCAACRARLDAIAIADRAYLSHHHDTLKAQDPAPPRPWRELRPELRQIDASIPRARRRSWRGWLAAAAALIVAVTVYSWIKR